MLQWNQRHETGHPAIDTEHREIFDRLNAIGDAMRRGADPEVLGGLIRLLLEYSSAHFRHEEHAMYCARCPAHGRNCAAHRAFVERLRHWLAVTSLGTTPASLIADIHQETCQWIESHIENIDVDLRACATVPDDCDRRQPC